MAADTGVKAATSSSPFLFQQQLIPGMTHGSQWGQ